MISRRFPALDFREQKPHVRFAERRHAATARNTVLVGESHARRIAPLSDLHGIM
jgi:hypothetical protein